MSCFPEEFVLSALMQWQRNWLSNGLSMGSSLQVILRQTAGEEQRPFVILGFLTGFGLSAVIGAAIYIYLM